MKVAETEGEGLPPPPPHPFPPASKLNVIFKGNFELEWPEAGKTFGEEAIELWERTKIEPSDMLDIDD